MPLKANDKEAHAYQMNALRAQFPIVHDVVVDALKRIRKLEIKVGKQAKAIATLERQIQPAYAAYKEKEYGRTKVSDGDKGS